MGASNDLALKVLLQASDQSGGVVKGFGASLASFLGSPAKMAGLGMVALGAGIVAVGIAATKMAGDYDQKMRMVQALTGSNNRQMGEYDKGVKSLAIDAGVAPKALASGLYNVLSASFKGADAMRVLTLATEDSKIGMTNATVTTDALTNILRSFGVQTKDITRTNGEMLETVTLGKATFEQYASTIVKSASAANQFHVSMETMNAAWSTMTSSGIRAAQASTDFQSSLKVMYGNINTVTGSLHKHGIAFDQAKFNMMSYGEKVQYLGAALEQANQKHVKITGVTLQAAQAISTINKHIGDYTSNLNKLSDKQAMAQKTQEAWKVTQGGFNQTMDRLHAVLDVVMISIGQKLLPVVTKFAQQLIPIVTEVGNWLVKSGALNTAVDMIGQTLSIMATVIGTIITKGAAFVNFLNQGSLAATGIKIVLGLLLGGIIGFIAFGIPPLVAGFIAWAAAATAAAIATLVAAAPFILVGIAIAAVVIIVILAVQHWGAIAHWLQGIWGTFSAWFMTAMHAVGQFFLKLWDGLVGGVKRAWAFIIQAVKIGGMILLAVILGPIIAIAALFIWLYQHNTYFKKLIDAIVDIVKAGIAWLQNAWQTVIGWIVNRWDYLKTMAEVYFNMAYLIIQTKINQVLSVIRSILTTILAYFNTKWNEAVNTVKTLWQKISQIFSSAWSAFVQSPLGQLLASITAWFQALPGKALTWGENLIKGFISGITNMAGGVGNAVSTIVGKVAGFLGFHSPTKEGPGAQSHTWAPNLMKMFTSGLMSGLPALTSTVGLISGKIASIANPQNTALSIQAGLQNAVSGQGVNVSTGAGARSYTGPGGLPGNAGGGGVNTYNITINALKATAKEVAQEVEAIINKKYKRSGNMVTVTSGGKA